MISPFRKIRKRMFTESRIAKYLLYALGEIVLVVIGILIALQLNNLNDQRKSREVVRLYYEQLLQDLDSDYKFIKETTLHYDSNRVKLEQYKSSFKENDIPPIQLLGHIGELSWLMRDIRFGSYTIGTLQNTGDIALIPPDIRERLIRFKTFQEQVVLSSSKNSDSVVEMANYATRFFGGSDLVQRMQNQPRLLAYTFQEERQIQILIALEAAQDRKELAEGINLEKFEVMLKDIEDLTGMINKELNK